ncbi:hypothetical protein BM74_11800 [Bacillus thuringiensis]|uniref:Uncharacterized protein n=1 Tax=Bacillus thuringiensis TaxID=1428 RepID=A0A437SL18_BACTU|nr:hypothetical protein [Bacillus cereus]OOZ89353.1 hypothetical protein BHL49_16525 [Bacillus cereus]RVU63958.1 hypothetical protein BM74_11800 [Bacillus thuringiensis]
MACSECEGDGAFDVEALFASQEKAKPPNILATGAGYHLKQKRLVQNKSYISNKIPITLQ